MSSTLTTDEKVDKIITFLQKLYGSNFLDPSGDAEVKPLPTEGTVKEGGWGADKDPHKWKIVNMRDRPVLFKLVDEAGKNVATDFTTKETAQYYIDYHKYIWKGETETEPEGPGPEGPEPEQPEQPEPEQPTSAEGETVTKDGVKVPVAIIGEFNYTVREDWRDGGARFNQTGPGSTSLVTVGYFTATGDGGDETSSKVLMGRHTGNAGDPDSYMGGGYDLGISTNGKKPRMRAENPHPKYTDTLSDPILSKDGLSFVGKWRGMMTIVRQEKEGVRIEWYQDQGDNETKPANQWVKLYEYFDTGQIAKIKKSCFEGNLFPIRDLKHCKGTNQTVWRCDETPGLKQKWIASAKIAGKVGA
jgi:hypothetical protein